MAEITVQGTTGGTQILYETPVGKTARVKYIRLNNSSAYTISLTKFDQSLSSTVTLYTNVLSAGDSVIDTTPYLLEAKDKITLITTAANTVYLALIDVT
jgi:hypothetical protein